MGGTEVSTIPKKVRVYKDTKANLDALTGLADEDLGYGTDTNILYRQNGNGAANWEAISAADFGGLTGRWTLVQGYRGTDGKILEFKGAGTDPAEGDKVTNHAFSAGQVLRQHQNTQLASTSQTYFKLWEMVILGGGTIRVNFAMKTSSAGNSAYARIYRNGGAVGTEQTDTTGSWVYKSEDIAGWKTGDLIQIYVKVTAGGHESILCDFRLLTS